MPLAGLERLSVTDLGPKPPQAAADIRANMEIYVPLAGIVDLAEERERIKKEIEKAEKEIATINKKFENPNYAARAPADLVEKDKARVAELESRIQKLGDNLRRIAPVEVKIAAPAAGNVNLEEELKEELSAVSVSAPDQQVKEALDKLREGTKEGLTSRDRYDLGVAYMNMGLVDDAVREFNKAKEGEGGAQGADEAAAAAQEPEKPAKKPSAGKKAEAAKRPAAKKARAKQAPAKKPPAKRPSAKTPATKKPAAKKLAAKKPAAKKPAAKKLSAKKPAAKKKR
jgi:valyl-tRNA synthetase